MTRPSTWKKQTGFFIGNTGSAVGATESKCVPSHWLIVAQKILIMY